MDHETDDFIAQNLVQDVAAADAKVVESFESLDRILDSYTALSSLLEVGKKNGNESFESYAVPVLTALYAGTGVELNEGDYSVESVSGMLKRAWDAIIRAIESFFKSLVDLLSNIDIASTWMMRNITVLERKRLASRGKVPNADKVSLGRQYRYLRVGRVFADDSLKLERELDNLLSVLKVISSDYMNAVTAAGAKLPSATNGKYGKDLQDALVQTVLEMPLDSIASKLKMSSAPPERFNRRDVLATAPLIGGDSIYYLKGDLLTKGVKGFRFYGLLYATTAKETLRVDESRDFKTLAPADLNGIPPLLREILSTVSKSAGDSTRSKIKKLRSDMENYVRSKSSDEHITESDLDAIRKTTSAMTYWSHSVTRPLFSASMSIVRATLSYCDASIKTYR